MPMHTPPPHLALGARNKGGGAGPGLALFPVRGSDRKLLRGGVSLSTCTGPVKGLSVCRVLARHLAC